MGTTKINVEGLALFHVNFGNNELFSMSSAPNFYVMARSYDEAVEKAYLKVESLPTKSVVGSDGSLNLNQEELKVRVVKLISDKIIW